jgi:hypothetical protein
MREAIRQVGLGPGYEVNQYWAQFDPRSETGKTLKRNSAHARRKEKKRARHAALARQAAKEERLREEEAATEKAAAERARAEEIKWIYQEAFESIGVLASMAEFPVPTAVGSHQVVSEEYVGRLVERTDDLLEYLWDKVHSGTWICPEIKEAVDLDLLLGLVLKFEAPQSYFPPATQNLAASLLGKWRDEDEDETDDNPHASSAP